MQNGNRARNSFTRAGTRSCLVSSWKKQPVKTWRNMLPKNCGNPWEQNPTHTGAWIKKTEQKKLFAVCTALPVILHASGNYWSTTENGTTSKSFRELISTKW